jgi:protein TonB
MRAVRNVGSEIVATTLPPRQETRFQQGNPAPRYPDILRAAQIEGSVVVEVATDENGIPDTSSIRVVATTHDLFAASVRQALTKWHLSPRANVRLPFLFVMSNKSASDLSAVPTGTIVITGVPLENPGVHVAGTVVSSAAPPPEPDSVRVRTTIRDVDVRRNVPRQTPADRDSLVIVDGVRQVRPVRVTTTDTLATRYVERPAAAGGMIARATTEPAYFEFQVEKPASPQPGNYAPRYPDSLRVARIEGEVLAQFVVDTLGHPDMNTFKVLRSTHDLFTNTVKQSLPNMLFYPAEVGDRKVKQLIQMPFQFNLSKDPN